MLLSGMGEGRKAATWMQSLGTWCKEEVLDLT